MYAAPTVALHLCGPYQASSSSQDTATLPHLPEHLRWSMVVDTGLGVDCILDGGSAPSGLENGVLMRERSVVVLHASGR